jgi:outer membrane protein OmpA-like peptidoglycan-associated protein
MRALSSLLPGLRPGLLPGLLALLAAAPAAHAQDSSAGFDAHNLHIAPYDGHVADPIAVHRVGFFRQGQGFAGTLFEFTDRALIYRLPGDAQPERVVLDNIFTSNLSGGYAIIDRVRVHAGLPIYYASTGLDGAQGGALGDLRLGATGVVARGDVGDFGVIPFLDLPTGAEDKFLGNQGLSGGFVLAGSLTAGIFTASADAGMRFVPAIDQRNLPGADKVTGGIAASFAATEDLGIIFEGRAESPIEQSPIPNSTFVGEFLGHVRYHLPELPVHFLLGGGAATSQGAGAPNARAFLGFGWAAPDEKPTNDKDGDGILDKQDACPEIPETMNGYKDKDGCADELARVDVEARLGKTALKGVDVVLKGPGVDAKRRTGEGNPLQANPEETWTATATMGTCFAGETSQELKEGSNILVVELVRQVGEVRVVVKDQDGIMLKDATIEWQTKGDTSCIPSESAKVEADGSSVQQLGAGVHRIVVQGPDRAPVVQDVTVKANTQQTIEVVMQVAKTKLEAERIVILDKVFFETGKATILPASFGLLTEVANVIKANPQILKVQVEGHTDDVGKDDVNLQLSQDRADSVRQWLIDAGVEGERLVAIGFGETKPVQSNKSAKGKAANRRVEFNIIETAKPKEGEK